MGWDGLGWDGVCLFCGVVGVGTCGGYNLWGVLGWVGVELLSGMCRLGLRYPVGEMILGLSGLRLSLTLVVW